MPGADSGMLVVPESQFAIVRLALLVVVAASLLRRNATLSEADIAVLSGKFVKLQAIKRSVIVK